MISHVLELENPMVFRVQCSLQDGYVDSAT
jgi:hypothetical protein